jgi:hypothetical protein
MPLTSVPIAEPGICPSDRKLAAGGGDDDGDGDGVGFGFGFAPAGPAAVTAVSTLAASASAASAAMRGVRNRVMIPLVLGPGPGIRAGAGAGAGCLRAGRSPGSPVFGWLITPPAGVSRNARFPADGVVPVAATRPPTAGAPPLLQSVIVPLLHVSACT